MGLEGSTDLHLLGEYYALAMNDPYICSRLPASATGARRTSHLANGSAFDEYYKAYSIAVMGGNERPELLYGGKSELNRAQCLDRN